MAPEMEKVLVRRFSNRYCAIKMSQQPILLYNNERGIDLPTKVIRKGQVFFLQMRGIM
jgi:hypothetical protein